MEIFASIRCLDCLYAIPLIFATGFVYAASRHENTHDIISHGLRFSASIAFFMLATLVLMLFLF